MQYLHDEQHYIDRYDLHTIEECVDIYWTIKDKAQNDKSTHFPKYTYEKFQQEINKVIGRTLFAIKGIRYQNKKKIITEWMDKDRRMQELYDNTPAPRDVLCRVCNSPMTAIHKHLHNSYESNARMMFMFECTQCKKRQSLFEDGAEWKYDPPKCSKCKHKLKTDMKIKGDITIFTTACSKCDYKDEDISDHKEWREKQEAEEKKAKELLEKYRAEFCLSEEEGQEYVDTLEAMEVAAVVREEERQKYIDPAYERSSHLKKTTINDLEKLLNKHLENAKYTRLSFDKPEIGQYVIVPFTVQDSDSSRKDKSSSSELERLIKTVLENTNWRLLSNSVMYRLGYLKGQLKGYEQEEDMLKLAGKKEEVKTKSNLDDEKRQKYSSHNLVRLARLLGEHDGIEDMRKRRLKKEPDGFLLNDGKDGYTCGVCGESISGDNTWWDLKGIRCLDCQRNLRAGTIPLDIFEDDYGYDVVIKSWEFKDNYGVHSSSVKKLRREGILIGRDLKRTDGSTYFTLYMVDENKEFIKRYPKQSMIQVKYIYNKEQKDKL